MLDVGLMFIKMKFVTKILELVLKYFWVKGNT